MDYYNRYSRFDAKGINRVIPRIEIENADSDLYIIFDKSTMRLDSLSYKYYADPNYGWFILLANPKLGSLEYLIPDQAMLRIPYPLDSALRRYETKVNEYINTH